METRRLVTVMLLAMAAILGWQLLMDAWFRSQGWNTGPTIEEVATTQPAPTSEADPVATAPVIDPVAATQPAPAEPAAPGSVAGLHVLEPQAPAAPVVLGSVEPRDETYSLAVAVSPRAGLSSVMLNRFRQEIKSDAPYTFQAPVEEADVVRQPLQTLAVTINGQTLDLSSAVWGLQNAANDSATYSLTIADSTQPVLRIDKMFRVRPRDEPGAGYETLVQHALVNLAQQPLEVQLSINGPATPPPEIDRGPDRHIIAGYNDHLRVRLDYHAVEAFSEDEPRKDMTTGPRSLPLAWVGANSVYFNAIVRPVSPQGGQPLIAKVEATALNPASRPEERKVALTLQTQEFNLAPGGQQLVPMQIFFGPKQRALLNSEYYAQFGYNQTLVMVSGICGICTWQWLIDILVWMLRTFHFVLHDWGLAIIALVCVVRALLHPITKRSQISMMKMSKMQPELERLKKKYGDNREELNKAMWEFQKQQGIGPYLGCLPMFLQMPIWIALWQALQSTFELRHAPFLHFNGVKLTWIYDLAKPDHLIEFDRSYEFFFLHFSGLNVLPILLGVVFYLQHKLMTPPPTTPEQAQQQKMMKWMMLLFPLFLYSGPSGLNLYILTSTTIGIIESKIVRRHIKEREEAEKEGKVIVDAGKRSGGGGHGKGTKPPEPKKTPQTGIAGWLSRLQAKAEEMQREAERKQRGKGKA